MGDPKWEYFENELAHHKVLVAMFKRKWEEQSQRNSVLADKLGDMENKHQNLRISRDMWRERAERAEKRLKLQ